MTSLEIALTQRIEELERELRTAEFNTESYLNEHGHWGDCRFRLELEKKNSQEEL